MHMMLTLVGSLVLVCIVDGSLKQEVHRFPNVEPQHAQGDPLSNTIKPIACSLIDLTNGSACGCATALAVACGDERGNGENGCSACVSSLANTTACSQTPMTKEAFCQSCSPSFNFQWIEELPPIQNASTQMLTDIDLLCRNEANVTTETEFVASGIDLLKTSGCNHHTAHAYVLGLGFKDPAANPLHFDAMEFLEGCCLGDKPDDQCIGKAFHSFWEFLRKATDGCQPDLLTKELATTGFAIPEVDPGNVFGGMYTLDLRKLSLIFEPLVGVAFNIIYGATIRYLLGLTFAAAERHSCVQSWFIPGADRLYSAIHRVQADFYYASNVPSPFDSEGTCGLSSTSEMARLSVCDKVGQYLYDNAHISGMSILGCTVDCTASRLDGIGGSFVSALVLITEIDTVSTGFAKTDGGVGLAVANLNREGFNMTNDVKSVVGVGFNFNVTMLRAEDVMATIDWNSDNSQSSNLTSGEVQPNMTEAMLVYKVNLNNDGVSDSQSTAKPVVHKHGSNNNTTIIIAAVVPVSVLIGVIVGFLVRRNSTQTRQNETMARGAPATVTNELGTRINDYEDTVTVNLDTSASTA
eukprot:m.205446 g.205446  ORF g.205446 m.205446 type:complete len:581 (+) comp32916_c0_seq6:241-1983(+)